MSYPNNVVRFCEIEEIVQNGLKKKVVVLEDTPSSSIIPVTFPNPLPVLVPLESVCHAIVRRSHVSNINDHAHAAATQSNSAALTDPAWDDFVTPASTKSIDRSRVIEELGTGEMEADANQSLPCIPTDPVSVTDTDKKIKIIPPKLEGHYIPIEGVILLGRYKIARILGRGSFGTVVDALDVLSDKRVAVKLIRSIETYRRACSNEVRILEFLGKRDPFNRGRFVQLLTYFDYQEHTCIVTNLLAQSLFSFLRMNRFRPFFPVQIQSFARQLCDSIAYLHSLDIIHTDLKPENVLLVSDEHELLYPPPDADEGPDPYLLLYNTDIRIIDFGCAIFATEYHPSLITTRYYRAPEVILGLGWSHPCDAFAIGCILLELYTGAPLFDALEDLEHLALMESTMGPIPERIARAGATSKPHLFDAHGTLAWQNPLTSMRTVARVTSRKTIEQIVNATDQATEAFCDLIKRLLTFDPDQRITVANALHHHYFSMEFEEV